MNQHPVPQQISSYQFRLVGDMTLKQFFQLAGGFLVALLFYASGLPAFIKWPFIIFFALLGIALAFLPFKERPLSAWIVAFFRTIYSPTEFVWTKYEKAPVFFVQDDVTTAQKEQKQDSQPAKPHSPSFLSNLESGEQAFLSQISQLLHGTQPISATQPEAEKNKIINIPENEPVLKTPQEIKPRILNQTPPIVIEKTVKTEIPSVPIEPTIKSEGKKDVQKAEFSPEAAPPVPPERPNTIVGQVMKPDGGIIEGAILEIKDEQGRPVRALKSNQLGHFIIVTSLNNGKYTISTEKIGFVFDDINFEADGSIIQPIAIRAKEVAKN